ncbi:DUF4355 domain-containing protein [Anaerocolumna sp.]|uniref:DUF4355 domain-containing protein n=1 Tax=Anaerocolumna sp. TaxID=2041569 RepID=UPI0028AD84AE|nr:DUF4355 domain-containing protein [Anaerocolumna sp.]
MDNEQNTNPTEGQSQEVKTFTQDEVNKIVGERLAKEKTKLEQAVTLREQELNKRELNLKAKELLTEKGLPLEILEALNYSNEDSLNNSISIIEKQLKKDAPPIVQGREPVRNGVSYSAQNGSSPSLDNNIRKAFGL